MTGSIWGDGSITGDWSTIKVPDSNGNNSSNGGNTGFFGGITDTFGNAYDTVSNTATDWLGKYLQYQTIKDNQKFQLQKSQQDTILKTVEQNQNVGAVPLAVQNAVPDSGFRLSNNQMLGVLAGVFAVVMLVKK